MVNLLVNSNDFYSTTSPLITSKEAYLIHPILKIERSKIFNLSKFNYAFTLSGDFLNRFTDYRLLFLP
jgi:hypothetical protein